MYPVIQIAGLTLNTAGLVVILAGWLGLTLAAREAQRRCPEPVEGLALDGDMVWDAAFYALIAGLIGARLWYVGAHWSAYQADLRQVLALNLGTLALGPGVIIGSITALVYLQRRDVPLSWLADALAPGLLLGLAVLRVGDFLTGRVLGAPTDVPWAVELWGMRRHPVALYEAGAALVALGIVWRLRDKGTYRGFVFLISLLLASAARLFLEAYRADSLQLVLSTVLSPSKGPVEGTAGGLRVAQVMALVVMLTAMGLLYHKHFANRIVSAESVRGE